MIEEHGKNSEIANYYGDSRSLHLFGWAIVMELESDGTEYVVYPAKVDYRGFDRDIEEEGFKELTKYPSKMPTCD